MPRNQTLTYLQHRFQEIGIQPDTGKGQNFLIDINLQKLLVKTAELTARDVALEVGTGTGALAELMADVAAVVVTVEVDPHLFELASEVLYGRPNVVMLRFDALKNKNRMNPEVLQAVRDALAAEPDRQFKLVANLPYSIATPVLTNLLAGDVVPVTMTATIQKEVADRLVASPGSKDYGSLSVWVQSQCDVQIVRTLPPSVFWPRPKVTSAIVHLRVDAAKRARIADLHYFHQFVRAIFIHRRKFLRSNLLGALKRHLSKAQVDAIMHAQQLGPDVRAEQLSVEAMAGLCEAVRQQAPDWTL